MQRSAPAVISCLLALFLQGCTCRAFWPQFTNALFDSPGDGVCRITVRNGHLLRYSAPVHPQDVPLKVREMMDKLGEGGRTAYVAREWGPDGPGYRWDRLVRPDPDGRDERRSWLLNDDGQVMERSYEIPPAQAPAKVLAHATALGLGRDAILWISIVLGAPGDEGRYRMLVKDRDGRQRMVESRADGSRAMWYRGAGDLEQVEPGRGPTGKPRPAGRPGSRDPCGP
ncbi:MAG: hypothetical protein ACYST0_05940 [Planctomycetota bacterium]